MVTERRNVRSTGSADDGQRVNTRRSNNALSER
jgi:hypothetical protein